MQQALVQQPANLPNVKTHEDIRRGIEQFSWVATNIEIAGQKETILNFLILSFIVDLPQLRSEISNYLNSKKDVFAPGYNFD